MTKARIRSLPLYLVAVVLLLGTLQGGVVLADEKWLGDLALDEKKVTASEGGDRNGRLPEAARRHDGDDDDDDDGGGGGQAATSPVGTWFGVARPCPATGDDAGHAAFCQAICGTCGSTPGTLPSEVPMMPTIHADGTVTVNDAASIPVFHTTAQGAWAVDPDPSQPQFPGRTRYQASFIWLQGDGGQPFNAKFIGLARPRFVVYWDPKNPDNMIGYIQPHFFPITDANGLVDVLPSGHKGSLDVTNHYPVIDPLAQLPPGCTPLQEGGNCFGTFHFTIHRVKANVPN